MEKMEELAETVMNAVQLLIDKKISNVTKALRLDERLAAIEANSIAGVSPKLESLERRASRGAEHLARLEDRVKALESGGR